MLQDWIKSSRLSCCFGTLPTAVSFRYLMLFPQIQTHSRYILLLQYYFYIRNMKSLIVSYNITYICIKLSNIIC